VNEKTAKLGGKCKHVTRIVRSKGEGIRTEKDSGMANSHVNRKKKGERNGQIQWEEVYRGDLGLGSWKAQEGLDRM